MQAAAIGAGALGCSISGSGPSVFALTTSEGSASAIGHAMGSALSPLEEKFTVYVSRVSATGARIVGRDGHAAD
jgi:homoserine kinase